MIKTLKQFIDENDGNFVEVAGSPGAQNQCVDLANAYLRDVLGHPIVEWTNARDFPSKLPDFEWIENTINAIPKPGDIIIWQHNEWGHISICIEAEQTFFLSFDENYPTGTPAHIQRHTYLRPKVAGWLRPPSNVETPPVDDVHDCQEERYKEERNSCSAEREELIRENEIIKIELQTEQDNFKDYRNHIGSFMREMVTILDPQTSIEIAEENLVKNLAKKVVSDHNDVTAELVKKEREWAKVEKELEEENLRLEKEVNSLKGELQTLLKRVEQVSGDIDRHKEKRVENNSLMEWIIGLFNKGK